MTCADMPRRSWRVREVATTATHRWLAHLPRRLLFGTSRHVGAFCVPLRQPLAAATRAAHDMCGHAPQILARARGRYHCHAPVACTFAKPAAFRHQPANKHGGARSGGSGGRSAGGRHPDQASGQPGAACAPLGEQAPPPAAAILHSFGRAGFSGGYSTQRHPSMDPDKGRPESPHQHPGIRIRPRSSPGLNAEVRNSKLPPLHRVA